MNTTRLKGALVAVVAAAAVSSACGLEDPTPETLSFRMDGPAGTQVEFIFSKYFVAGSNELGETAAAVVTADTVVATLPMDTVFDVAVEKRWLVLATPVGVDGVPVEVRIDINNRNVHTDDGDLFVAEPWRYVYMFNARLSESADIVF